MKVDITRFKSVLLTNKNIKIEEIREEEVLPEVGINNTAGITDSITILRIITDIPIYSFSFFKSVLLIKVGITRFKSVLPIKIGGNYG